MPPRASLRRSTRASVRDSDASPSPVANFQKPNLPVLQGTPSSRRQYTYGAEAEPLPTRPGRGLRGGQMIDLGSAVRDVMTRQEQEQEQEHIVDKATGQHSRSRQPRQPSRADEDELAAEEPAFRPKAPSFAFQPRSTRLDVLGQSQSPDNSDADDVRSFGMESDYYGDATIASTVSSIAPPLAPRDSAIAMTATSQPQHTRLKALPEKSVLETQKSSTLFEEAAKVVADRATQPTVKDVQEPAKSRPSPKRITRSLPNDDKPSDEEEIEVTSRRAGFRLRKQAKTLTDPKESRRTATTAGRSDNNGPTREPMNRRQNSRGQSQDERKRLNIGSGPTANGPSLFERARNMAANHSPFSNKHQFPSDHSERDEAVQRTIQLEIQEAEEELDREARLRARQARLEMWQERWIRLKSYPPLSLFFEQQPDEDENSDSDESDPGRNDAINWWELLYPGTYLRAALWLFGADHIRWPLSQQSFLALMRYIMYIGGGILALILTLIMSSAAITGLQNSSLSLPSLPTGPTIPWSSLGNVPAAIGGYIPRIPWPSGGRWDDLSDLWELDGTERGEIEDLFKRYSQEIKALKSSRNLHDLSLKKLEAVVPKVVHMQLKDGKPVVAQEFYHGLRDLAHEDDSFLMLEKKGDGYEVSSEKHWQAIASRLGKDPTFNDKLNLSIGELEDRLDSKMANSWDAWVKNNDGKISEMLGSELDKIQLVGSDREFDKRLGKVVKEHLDDSNRSGTVVSRDEFLRHLKNEFSTHRAEIRAELNEIHPKLEGYVRESLEMAMKDAPASMSRSEITTLVHGLVRKSIADMNLEAMAKGKIHAHWDADLKNRVNYFNLGSGATIDAKHSSQTYNPVRKAAHKKGIVSDGLFNHGLRDVKPSPHIAALLPWQDEGDCWCAARSVDNHGNPHGASLVVQLAHTVVPQHIVVEHILPGATTDPGARPRNIEVFADISDIAVRERVRDFSATHFPNESEWDFQAAELRQSFVKIGQFVYEGAELHDGVYVYQLSEELVKLGAETDQVALRALTNYGAKEHTCFYRVRLFGRKIDAEQ